MFHTLHAASSWSTHSETCFKMVTSYCPNVSGATIAHIQHASSVYKATAMNSHNQNLLVLWTLIFIEIFITFVVSVEQHPSLVMAEIYYEPTGCNCNGKVIDRAKQPISDIERFSQAHPTPEPTSTLQPLKPSLSPLKAKPSVCFSSLQNPFQTNNNSPKSY